jgi:hypothetical protein
VDDREALESGVKTAAFQTLPPIAVFTVNSL